jgi:hypothetical protein
MHKREECIQESGAGRDKKTVERWGVGIDAVSVVVAIFWVNFTNYPLKSR